MPSSDRFIDSTLAAFARAVSETTPTPAGGSVSALVGALGASLVSMAFRHAASDNESSIPAYMQGRAEELDDLRDLLLELVDRDARAYAALCKARGEGDDARTAKAAFEALEAPMETAEFSLAALRLFAVGVAHVPERLRSDCAVALSALRAAVDGGLAVADVNRGDAPDGEARGDHGATVRMIRDESERLAREIGSGLHAGHTGQGEGAGA